MKNILLRLFQPHRCDKVQEAEEELDKATVRHQEVSDSLVSTMQELHDKLQGEPEELPGVSRR